MSLNKNEGMGRDLRLRFDELGADLSISRKGDLNIVSDEDNLAQAIIARLSTEQGELYDTGHLDYGSRLNEVIGEISNELTRRKIRLVVQECLSQESRIQEITSVNILSDPYDRHKVNIEVTIVPIGAKQPLTLMYPFNLEG